MSFDSLESSVEDSEPVELIEIVLGSEVFRYTSTEDEITISGITYEPEPAVRSSIGQGSEERTNRVELSLSGDNTFVQKYLPSVPGQKAVVTIMRIQRGDLPSPTVVQLFTGAVQSVVFTDQGKLAKVAVAPTASAASRTIPRWTYQGPCNNVLYDDLCTVNQADFLFTGEVLSQDGNDIEVDGADAFADDHFTAGFAEAFGGTDFRLITDHVGTTITLLLPFPFSVVGSSINLFAGCDHSIATCKNKFDNVINHGGFAFVPTENPFETGIG